MRVRHGAAALDIADDLTVIVADLQAARARIVDVPEALALAKPPCPDTITIRDYPLDLRIGRALKCACDDTTDRADVPRRVSVVVHVLLG